MLQFYFLSILANLLAGTALSSDYLGQKITSFAPIKDFLTGKGSKVALGFFAVVVGIMKLILRTPGDTVPVAGDLFPALSGIAMGLVLLTDFFKEKVAKESEALDKAEKIALTYRMPLGMVGLAAAILHFIVPTAVIF